VKRSWPVIGSTVTAAIVISAAPAAAEDGDPGPVPVVGTVDEAALPEVDATVVDDVEAAIDEAIEEAVTSALVIPVEPAPGGTGGTLADAVEIDATSGTVVAPTLDDDTSLSLTLPIDEVGAATEEGDTTLLEGEDTTYSTAVRLQDDGSFRALVHIDSPEAPTEYEFDLTLPVGATLAERPDGGVDVRTPTGDLLGSFAPAWAVAADGRSVPSTYEIRGHTIVQRVALTPGLAYPIVADPFWIPFLLILGHFTAHAARQAAARGVSQALVRQVIQNGRRTAGNNNTSVFTQGSGGNRIRVIVDNRTGNIITVTKG
jgi:hypothetical protein